MTAAASGGSSGGELGRLSAVQAKWRTVTPGESRWYAMPHTARGRASLAATLRVLPADASIVLFDTWPLSRRRCRKLAAQAAVSVVREYLALPTLRRAIALVQDEDSTAQYFAAQLVSAPPSPSWVLRALDPLLPLCRWMLARRWRGVVFGGRLVIGARS